jgi:hypothetical protein
MKQPTRQYCRQRASSLRILYFFLLVQASAFASRLDRPGQDMNQNGQPLSSKPTMAAQSAETANSNEDKIILTDKVGGVLAELYYQYIQQAQAASSQQATFSGTSDSPSDTPSSVPSDVASNVMSVAPSADVDLSGSNPDDNAVASAGSANPLSPPAPLPPTNPPPDNTASKSSNTQNPDQILPSSSLYVTSAGYPVDSKGNIIIELVAQSSDEDVVNSLLQKAKELGFVEGSRWKGIIGGEIPVKSLQALSEIPELRYARPVIAINNRARRTRADATSCPL